MPRQRQDSDSTLRALDASDGCADLRAALANRHYRVVARAAELAAERLCYDLEAELISAFRHLAACDYKRDPGCLAKGALARALVALDCLDAKFYREGIALRQPEPVWGGSVDTAADVRSSCAMGLAASGDPQALIALVDLLADPEHRARSGAVRAIACTAPFAAEAVLRAKALLGDSEPEVTGECLRALLALAPDTTPAFVARFLDPTSALLGAADARVASTDGAEILPELAALALGESRLDDAVALLRARWEEQPFKGAHERVLLRAAALARTDAAFDWLLGLIETVDAATAAFLLEELAVYRSNARLTERVAAALGTRGDAALNAAFERRWR
jgi:HEAT repeat protein